MSGTSRDERANPSRFPRASTRSLAPKRTDRTDWIGWCVRWLPVVLVVFGVALAILRVYRYLNLGDSFDTGLLANVLWRVAHGLDSRSAMTGGYYVSTHASGIVAMFLPAYRWAPTAAMPAMLVAQVASVMLVAWAARLIAEALGLPPRIQLLAALVIALSPAAFLASQFEIHETTLGLGPLAMSIALSIRRDSKFAIAIWALLASASRIEMAFTVLLVGAIIWSYKEFRNWVVLSIGFIAVSLYLVWLFSNPYQTESIAAHFSYLGSTPREVLVTATLHPWRLLGPLASSQMWISILFWLLPFGLVVPLLSPRWLVAALPSAGVAIFGVWAKADYFIHHYWYIFLVVGTCALLFTARSRPAVVRRLPMLLGAGLVASWILMAPLMGFFGPHGDPAAGEVIAEVRRDDPGYVSAPMSMVALLANRPLVSPFPRPFECADSIGPYTAPDRPPDELIIAAGGRDELATSARRAFDRLLKQYTLIRRTGQFEVWRLVDAVAARSAYVPCSSATFVPSD